VICPIRVERGAVGIALAFGLVTTFVPFPNRSGLIGRGRGVILLAIYAVYVVLLLKP